MSLAGPSDVDEGETTTDYTVSVDQATTAPLTVTFTYSGVAVDGTDFTGVAQVIIPADATSTTFDIATIDDNIAEGSEVYTVTINTVTGGGFELVEAHPTDNSVDTTICEEEKADQQRQTALVRLGGASEVEGGESAAV